jgi:hypothetical protein
MRLRHFGPIVFYIDWFIIICCEVIFGFLGTLYVSNSLEFPVVLDKQFTGEEYNRQVHPLTAIDLHSEGTVLLTQSVRHVLPRFSTVSFDKCLQTAWKFEACILSLIRNPCLLMISTPSYTFRSYEIVVRFFNMLSEADVTARTNRRDRMWIQQWRSIYVT